MKTFTKEQKQEYFKHLRESWQKAKELAETSEVKAIIQEAQANGNRVSAYGIAYIWQQMREQGLDGVPHIDAKTFQGWQGSGFTVKKGEKSKLEGITWVGNNAKDSEDKEDNGYKFPKAYHLFHRSQVQAI